MEKILILGGTQFIGRNLVESLLSTQEYHLTLFNRGKTASHLFPNIDLIKGDRETNDIEEIGKIKWDYIIDTSCFYPASLTDVLNNLSHPPKKYIFISTCSVYDSEKDTSILRDEQAKTLECSNEQALDREVSTYGNRKAKCERILRDSGLNYTIFRPALVYGEYDYTDRFYYWLYQVKFKGKLLLPDNGERKFSITYIADLINAILKSLHQNTKTTYNIISTPQVSIQKIVTTTKEILQKDTEEINASPEFLNQNNIGQWMDMPLWIDGDHFTFSNTKIKNELNFEPTSLKTGVRQAISYHEGKDWSEPQYGISETKRLELISLLENTSAA